MTDWKKLSGEIFESFFKQTEDYAARVRNSGGSYIDGLLAYYQEAWIVPKRFKGNSAAMGFIPEFLIFEAVKLHLEKKYGFKFNQKDRSLVLGDQTETAYFVDGPEPRRLLLQGLRIRENPDGYPNTDCQHDITYLVKDGTWRVKAVIEVKGYFESGSLKGDIDKLERAENGYPKADNAVFAFVGFIDSPDLSGPARDVAHGFVERESKNHFVILPGKPDPEIGNSRLEDLLSRL